MRANFNKKYEHEDHSRFNPNGGNTGDFFYDNVSKFCNGSIKPDQQKGSNPNNNDGKEGNGDGANKTAPINPTSGEHYHRPIM